jgi:hypothetical protein
MKRVRLVLSFVVLLTVFGAMSVTQTSFADSEDGKCDCKYPNSGNFGVMRWWYGVWKCVVEDCWIQIQ